MFSGIYFHENAIKQGLSCSLFHLKCWKSPKYNVLSEVKFVKNLTEEGHLM